MKENWFNKTVTETLESLTTNANEGLKSEEIEERRKKYGFNELKAKKKKTILVKFLEQFRDFMIIVLIIAAIVSGIIGVAQGEGITDTIIILQIMISSFRP